MYPELGLECAYLRLTVRYLKATSPAWQALFSPPGAFSPLPPLTPQRRRSYSGATSSNGVPTVPVTPWKSTLLQATLLLLVALGLLAPGAGGQDLEFNRDRMQMMLETVSRRVERHFYDPTLRGLDWQALTRQAEERIENAGNLGEMVTAIFTLVEQLKDSHTAFLPPPRNVKAIFGFSAKPFGNEIRIYELDEDGPAARAGLQLGDRLWAVNSFNAERSSWDLMMLYLRVLRPVAVMEIYCSRGHERPRKFRVQAEIKQGKVRTDLTRVYDIYQLIREAEKEEAEDPFRYGSYRGGIGYLYLPYFTGDQSFLNRLVNEIKDARAVIIDLRGNPGGAVKGLTHLARFFTSERTVMAQLVARKKTETLEIKPKKPHLTGPLFVLVDSQSASAAEIFARFIQRTERGVVIGDRTSGRVNASRFYQHRIGQDTIVPYGVQVAFARVVFPGGEELENLGVEPDLSCIPSQEDLQKQRDPCEALAVLLARQALGIAEEKNEEKPD